MTLHKLPVCRDDLYCAPHRVATALCSRHVDELAPWSWNGLPIYLKLLQSADSLDCRLKTYLFESLYGHLGYRVICSVVHQYSSPGCNTNAYIPVTVGCMRHQSSATGIWGADTFICNHCWIHHFDCFTNTYTTILWPSWILSGTTLECWHRKVKPGR